MILVDLQSEKLGAPKTWYRGIRKALAHRAITEISSARTVYRLVHTDCARRQPGPVQHDPDQPTPDA